MLSGKSKVQRNVGSTQLSFEQQAMANDADLTIIEDLHDYHNGFLVWPNADNTSQFETDRIGYRGVDIFLMSVKTEYMPVWHDGFYTQGNDISFELEEVI